MRKPRQGRVNPPACGKRESSSSCPIPQSITLVHLRPLQRHHDSTDAASVSLCAAPLPALPHRRAIAVLAPVDSSSGSLFPEYTICKWQSALLRRRIIGLCIHCQTCSACPPRYTQLLPPTPSTLPSTLPPPPSSQQSPPLRLLLAPVDNGPQHPRSSRCQPRHGHGQAGCRTD